MRGRRLRNCTSRRAPACAIGVEILPHAFPLFGVSVSELTQCIVPVADVLGRLARDSGAARTLD